jgi:hypothetical protein
MWFFTKRERVRIAAIQRGPSCRKVVDNVTVINRSRIAPESNGVLMWPYIYYSVYVLRPVDRFHSRVRDLIDTPRVSSSGLLSVRRLFSGPEYLYPISTRWARGRRLQLWNGTRLITTKPSQVWCCAQRRIWGVTGSGGKLTHGSWYLLTKLARRVKGQSPLRLSTGSYVLITLIQNVVQKYNTRKPHSLTIRLSKSRWIELY